MIKDKAELYIQKYSMLPDGGTVLCAVSGGADSVCLLHLLCGMEGVKVVCAHYNHCLRGAESDRDERFVIELCEGLNIKCITGRGNVAAYAAENGMGTEEAARKLRYEFLEEAADGCGAEKIATAHNADDNAETILLNLSRGAGLNGLCGIPPVRGRIIRPLLGVTRDEIIEYLAENGLEHIEDSSNASDDYSRNRLRHHVLPVLRENNASAVKNIAAAAETLREDEDYLSSLAEEFIGAKLYDGSLPVDGLIKLPKPVMMRVFRRMCGAGLEGVHAESLRKMCLNRAVHSSCDVPGMRVTRERDRLIFDQREIISFGPVTVEPDSVTRVPGAGFEIISETVDKCEEINKSLNTFYFKSEKICGRIVVAPRADGDKIELEGRKCTKSLKKLFLEAGMPLEKRAVTPVVYDEAGVIAVYGFGTAQRCAAAKGDNVTIIRIIYK